MITKENFPSIIITVTAREIAAISPLDREFVSADLVEEACLDKRRVRETIRRWIYPANEFVTLKLNGETYFEGIAREIEKELGL